LDANFPGMAPTGVSVVPLFPFLGQLPVTYWALFILLSGDEPFPSGGIPKT